MRLLPLVLLAACMGCRSPKCHGDLDSDDVRRLQQLDEDGKYPCPEHLRPEIRISADGVVLNGRQIVKAAGMPSGRLQKIHPLFSELKLARELWKQVHPSQMFEPLPSVEVDGSLDAKAAASAIASIAFAGYPHLKLKTGGVLIDWYYAVPGPPHPDEPPPAFLLIERTPDGMQRVSFHRGQVIYASTSEPIPFEEVPGWVRERCAKSSEPCPSIIALRPSGPFAVSATLVRNLVDRGALGTRVVTLRFLDDGY